MKEYPPDKVRNVALIGHGSTGKTSLAEAMLFASGATTRLGRVEDGTTVSDWDPDEQKRGLSVNLAVVPVEGGGPNINVVDAPGYAHFPGEVGKGVRAGILAGSIVPVLTGSATKMFGIQALLEAVGATFPSPADAPTKTNGDTLKAAASGPLAALALKAAPD